MNGIEWNAIKTNDPSYDGTFYYALSTTKTFCRPSCPSRTPNPNHVSIFQEPAAAKAAGYRPCLRCKPTTEGWLGYKEHLAKASLAYITAHYKQPLSLSDLSLALKKNQHYILRSFKEVYQMTPLTYTHFLRIQEAKRLLTETTDSITTIALEIGYNDSAQFSATFKKQVGQPPTAYRKQSTGYNSD